MLSLRNIAVPYALTDLPSPHNRQCLALPVNRGLRNKQESCPPDGERKTDLGNYSENFCKFNRLYSCSILVRQRMLTKFRLVRARWLFPTGLVATQRSCVAGMEGSGLTSEFIAGKCNNYVEEISLRVLET